MQIQFRNIRGSKVVHFRNSKGEYVCSLRKSHFQPQFGWRLEIIREILHQENDVPFSYVYKTIKTFSQSNAGMDYVYANFDKLNEEYNNIIRA